jgi:hypothetical protein
MLLAGALTSPYPLRREHLYEPKRLLSCQGLPLIRQIAWWHRSWTWSLLIYLCTLNWMNESCCWTIQFTELYITVQEKYILILVMDMRFWNGEKHGLPVILPSKFSEVAETDSQIPWPHHHILLTAHELAVTGSGAATHQGEYSTCRGNSFLLCYELIQQQDTTKRGGERHCKVNVSLLAKMFSGSHTLPCS